MALAQVIDLLNAGDYDQGMRMFSALIGDVGPRRDVLLGQICDALASVRDTRVCAHLALGGGALIENGAPADRLGRALIAPLTRALCDAGRVLDAVAAMPELELDHADGEEHDHGDAVAVIAGKHVASEDLRALGHRDPDATTGWRSMECWYRPAVASLTRARDVLREVQRDRVVCDAVRRLGHETASSHWLGQLLPALLGDTMVALIPELGETWTLVADGVTDTGQLCVLLSDALADPLGRLGVTSAGDDVLDVMRGDGPQQGDGGYSCAFHVYPIEAVDPADGLPKDGRFMWRAPGGTGSHSLPPDFLPGDLTVVDGTRTIVIAGPELPGMRFVRLIQAVRTFDGLRAEIRDVRRVS